MEFLYKRDSQARKLIEDWFSERSLKPKNDNQLREYLALLLKEQLYTFSIKVLFYLVLQSIDTKMASKLQEKLKGNPFDDPLLFKAIDCLPSRSDFIP